MSDKPPTIRVGTYNLFKGGVAGLADHDRAAEFGCPGLDTTRLRDQLAMLSRLNLDFLGLQEATWGAHSPDLMNFVADELGMFPCCVGPSNFYGCDLAAFVRQNDHLTVEDVTHLNGPPFVHGLTNIKLAIDGHPRPVHFLVGHSAPSSPGARLLEAETVTVHRDLDVIYVADFNAAAIDDNPDTTGLDPYKTAKKLITAPAQELAAAGFGDIGHIWGDRTPTVGHGTDKLAYRCDRILTTLPAAWITGYGVETGADHLSDHRAVWAELTLTDQFQEQHHEHL
ncbi:endonuclease/exonuclease/phosphatase family protein [Actinomadura rubrisoli]|uniref:Endonuclease/exonuclease/phosphatase family protein n=1 Tax=Actinomadura rubrisoli TaxID=2530368 RepID=A0A4R4ZMX8_9ACTN|nr:endonuclease/exonuclease/phosphatase family protein [Actinomadura rubrisoli]TDD59069.1 endonuclease/exonuclease/phosphatase family protein [Actinomadura rubrisoli]